MRTFLWSGMKTKGYVHHKDGNPHNHHLDNLEIRHTTPINIIDPELTKRLAANEANHPKPVKE